MVINSNSNSYWKTCVGCGKMGYFNKVCHRKGSRAVNEIELEMSQEYSEGKIETFKPDIKPYQVPLRHVAYALQKLF